MSDVYSSSIRAFSDEDLLSRLSAAQLFIIAEEENYRCLAREGRLHLFQRSNSVNGNIHKDEMKALYKLGMVAVNSEGRHYYDKIMDIPHKTCPLCGQGKVHTLDHHLPKSKYPSLAVTPINLVPACRDCNMAKVINAPQTEEEQTLHPYFDDFTGMRWLHARVDEGALPAVLFEVQLPTEWPEIVGKRLRHHMKVFKLEAAFTLYASDELSQISPELQDLHKKGGSEAVRHELQTRAYNRERSHLNSWQTAMLYALANSEWFCREGLLLLKPTKIEGPSILFSSPEILT